MGSPSFGMPSSNNNAPLPIPGNTNPTGTNSGVSYGGASFPNYPVFGSPSSGPVSNAANTPYNASNLSGLFSNPLSNYYTNTGFWNDVGKAYGKGTGQALQTEFGQLFNPNVVASYLNALQPAFLQGQSSVMDAFGAEGSRFGSAAALGLSNYDAQFGATEQQTIAQMYQNAVNQELAVTTGMLPTLHDEKANSGGWMHDLVGGLEIAGSIAAAPFTGGTSLMALPAGISELNSGINSGSGSGSTPSTAGFNPFAGVGNTGTFGNYAPTWNSNSNSMWDKLWQDMQSETAASSLGGVSPSGIFNPPSTDANAVPIFQ